MPHWVLTVCFIPYVSSVIITAGWFTLLSKCICLAAYCGELSNCITLKSPCWLRHGWCLTFTPLCQEKGHCYELMTEQCSATFDYPAFYLFLPPPTVFSFPGHCNISLTLIPVVLQTTFCSVDSPTARQERHINSTWPCSWPLVLHFNYIFRSHEPDFPLPPIQYISLNFHGLNWTDSKTQDLHPKPCLQVTSTVIWPRLTSS